MQWLCQVASNKRSKPAFDALQQEIAPVLRAPKLNVFPTADGYKLAWNVIGFSRNPFGLFVTQIDASNGKCSLAKIKCFRSSPLPYTADIYPNHPEMANPDTGELKLEGKANRPACCVFNFATTTKVRMRPGSPAR